MRLLVLVFGVAFGLLIYSWAGAYPGEFGTPATPQNIQENSAYAHYDIQIHNRNNPAQWDEPVNAQHTNTCGAPPGTHPVSAVADSVYICNDHLMTAANAGGYGLIAVTPSQLLNCSAGCVVQWDMSTERMSLRDWPDVWLTPWLDNLTLPFSLGDVDLQGVPRQGIHVNAEAGQNSWTVTTIANYNETDLPNAWWVGMHEGITAGTNQSAVRQTFRLTITPGHVKMERLASPTASQFTWVDTDCACLLASDYVVQFAHHSYTPTKADPGEPGTWHWGNFTLTPSTPFTLIHSSPALVQANNTLVTFNSPTPIGVQSWLRFSGVCRVLIDGVMAPRQTFLGKEEHASNYFIPIAQGKESVNVSFASDDWYAGPCSAKDFHVWSRGGASSTPTPSPTSSPLPTSTSIPTLTPTLSSTSTPSPSPIATATPSPALPSPTPTATFIPSTATPTPTASTIVTFDNLAGQNQPLNGQYPTGLINWGSNKWFLSGPWAPFSTKSISFNNGTGTSRTFVFVNPRVLVSLKAGGVGTSTITLACAGNPNKVQAIAPNVVTTIVTGWTVPCTTVTVASSNGWDTNFDDLLVQ